MIWSGGPEQGGCRVEMTVSRGVLRIAGTIVGGSIGFLIMLHYSLAANPYALMASPLILRLCTLLRSSWCTS